MNEEQLSDWLRLLREEARNIQQQLNFISVLLAAITTALVLLVWHVW